MLLHEPRHLWQGTVCSKTCATEGRPCLYIHDYQYLSMCVSIARGHGYGVPVDPACNNMGSYGSLYVAMLRYRGPGSRYHITRSDVEQPGQDRLNKELPGPGKGDRGYSLLLKSV